MSTLRQIFKPIHPPKLSEQPLPSTLTRINGRDGSNNSEHENLPLVTVITVVLNGKATLGRTLASVSRQTYPRIEHIIIDGGSNDGSVGIIRNAQYISAWSSEPDHGIYDAMNKGVAAARGRYIAVLNADDWYEPQMIECAVQSLRTSSRGFVFGDLEYYFPQNSLGRMRRPGDPQYTRMLPGKVPSTWHPAMVCDRKMYETIGLYRTDMKIAADLDWQVRAFNQGFRGIYDPRVVTHHWGGGISSINQRQAIKEGFVCAIAGGAWGPSTLAYWFVRYTQVRMPRTFRKSRSILRRMRAVLGSTKRLPSKVKSNLPLKQQIKRFIGAVGGSRFIGQHTQTPAPASSTRSPSPLLAFVGARDESPFLTDSAIELLIARAPSWKTAAIDDPSDKAGAVRIALEHMGVQITQIASDRDPKIQSDLLIAPDWDRDRAAGSGARECIVIDDGPFAERVPLESEEVTNQRVLSLCSCSRGH